ncbi:hypothetical protein CEXT_220601 [Caerostris extrusa]|uniref:Uncharacterized protein n=1 Tax=Caerostris extrusa TaxID=172846 RepID=A0AAV4MZR0_CAEEX|nr:hypothetical protein CEXT_220601 [Caerostris extrusa]
MNFLIVTLPFMSSTELCIRPKRLSALDSMICPVNFSLNWVKMLNRLFLPSIILLGNFIPPQNGKEATIVPHLKPQKTTDNPSS